MTPETKPDLTKQPPRDPDAQRKTPSSIGDAIGAGLEQWKAMFAESAKVAHPLETAFEQAANAIVCKVHRTKQVKSWQLTTAGYDGEMTVRYEACQQCQAERNAVARRELLVKAGVPEVLLESSFENFECTEDWQHTAVKKCRQFVEARRGVLFLMGETGTGKDHLSVAVAKHFPRFTYTTHSRMVRKLRATYSTGGTEDYIVELEETPLLVISELGVSARGNDEQTVLYDVLSARYSRFMPTVINSNLPFTSADGQPTLTTALGERLVSRLRESAFASIEFHGADYRIKNRKNYFQ